MCPLLVNVVDLRLSMEVTVWVMLCRFRPISNIIRQDTSSQAAIHGGYPSMSRSVMISEVLPWHWWIDKTIFKLCLLCPFGSKETNFGNKTLDHAELISIFMAPACLVPTEENGCWLNMRETWDICLGFPSQVWIIFCLTWKYFLDECRQCHSKSTREQYLIHCRQFVQHNFFSTKF